MLNHITFEFQRKYKSLGLFEDKYIIKQLQSTCSQALIIVIIKSDEAKFIII